MSREKDLFVQIMLCTKYILCPNSHCDRLGILTYMYLILFTFIWTVLLAWYSVLISAEHAEGSSLISVGSQ